VNLTGNGLWSDAETLDELGGLCGGFGASGGLGVAGNSDYCLSPSGVSTQVTGVGGGAGGEAHIRGGRTWVFDL
jgi:hypothetical protein